MNFRGRLRGWREISSVHLMAWGRSHVYVGVWFYWNFVEVGRKLTPSYTVHYALVSLHGANPLWHAQTFTKGNHAEDNSHQFGTLCAQGVCDGW
jgi:hypothetical protein